MTIDSAVKLVNELIYKPGWAITAEDHSNRFEGAVRVRIDYPARNSNRDQAAQGYPEEITTYATFPVMVQDCTDEDLYAAILSLIVTVEEHEAREFLRVEPTDWAPFHPHRVGGMRRWAARQGAQDLSRDFQFGLA